jgi:hypothetical protein
VPPTISEALALLRAAVEQASDGLCLDANARCNALEELFTAESVLRAAQTQLLAEVDLTAATVEATGRASRSWLVEEQMFSPAEAGRRLRIARGLGEFPLTGQAFAVGDISAEHVLVIIAGLAQITDTGVRATVEEQLVGLSRLHPAPEVAGLLDQLLVALGVEPSADEAAARRYATRQVSLADTFGGTGSLSGTLTSEVREKLQLALAAAGMKAGPEDTRSTGQRMHDALGEIAGHYLATAALPDINGERPRLVVTMQLDALLGNLQDQWATLGAGLPIAPATARRLACDAEIIPAVLDATSDVLDLGRSSRAFSTAIRRAAWLRDGARCAFGGCRRRISELHHIIWWSHGGHTSLDNAAWLCAFHHWLAHEGGWTLRRNATNSYTWTSPTGQQHTGDPPPRQPQAA